MADQDPPASPVQAALEGPCNYRLKGGKRCVLKAYHDGPHSPTPVDVTAAEGETVGERLGNGFTGPSAPPQDGPKMPALVPRPDGRGALYAGGVPGNRGGGKPANAVRAAAREAFADRLPMLAALADGEVRTRLVGVCKECGAEDTKKLTEAELRAAFPTVSDRIYALRTLAMFSDLKDSGLPDDGLLQELGQAVVDVVGPEPWQKIETAWVDLLSRRIR